ncbi:unnamed protein product [Polarella glacialis]|uniref:Reverse transcriptase Ty1/copia-type domain-containing protein n=1 Tax=Polarella glacialis TaxID=89957 RepID=A0A813F1N9_POLGL|nr:unnamed protein product [Polarella glacialis]
MYGARDAAQGWENTYRRALETLGFWRGRASPCVFSHESREVFLAVHGDDFFATGAPDDLDWFEKALLKTFEGKVKGRLTQADDELRILNRIVRRTDAGYEWEADQRHAEMLIKSAGLDHESRPLSAPGRKLTSKELEVEPELLGDWEATSFRAMAARANFLASDRPDTAFAVKELSRDVGPDDTGCRGLEAAIPILAGATAPDHPLRLARCAKILGCIQRLGLGGLRQNPQVRQRR